MLGLLFAIIVAIFWSLGEVNYSKVSKKVDKTNVYLYTYLIRTILYLGVVVLFQKSLLGTFNLTKCSNMLPIIFCDLFASLVINIAVYNGKLSVVSPIMASYPVLDIFLGILLLKEKISPLEIILVFLISMAIILLAMNQKKTKKAPHPIKGIIFSIVYMSLVALSTYFEKTIYINHYTVYDLYYYKGMIYGITSLIFFLNILLTPTKIKKPNKEIIKGCGLTPIGNILYSFALHFGSITIVTPVSSLYSVLTNYLSRIYLKEKTSKIEKVSITILLVSTIILIVLKIS